MLLHADMQKADARSAKKREGREPQEDAARPRRDAQRQNPEDNQNAIRPPLPQAELARSHAKQVLGAEGSRQGGHPQNKDQDTSAEIISSHEAVIGAGGGAAKNGQTKGEADNPLGFDGRSGDTLS